MAAPTAKELRRILDPVLTAIDADPESGPRLRAAAAPLRVEVPELRFVLNVAPAEGRGGCLAWDFSQKAATEPRLVLRFSGAEVANRFLQGSENPAIALARGRAKLSIADAGAAVRFFPAAKPLLDRYRAEVADNYPHLLVNG